MGSLRVSFKDSLSIAKVTQESHTGVFGDVLPSLVYINTPKTDNFDYTGHERLKAFNLGYLDAGARWYDPLVPRFTTIDPFAETSRRFSPFTYGNNNPVRFIDLDGMEAKGFEYSNGYSTQDSRNETGAVSHEGAFLNIEGGDDKPKVKTEAQRLSEIVTVKGQKYHKNTGNVFAAIGNSVNSFFGGSSDYFVDMKPYDPVEDEAVHAFFDNGVAVIAGGVIGKAIGRLAEGFAKTMIPLTRKTFGHTFTTHGEEMTNFLMNRANGSGMAQGQFLDNQQAAKFILDNLGKASNGAVNVPLPNGFPARVILPNGTFEAATHIRIVPSGVGVKTAYPLIP